MISREKSSRGSDSPRRPTRSDLRKFICKFSRPPAELARENFPTAGHASECATDFRITDFEQHDCAKSTGRSVERCDLWAAVKSPLGAQTVLGDRHDLIYENLFASPVGRLRNSPERTFQRLGTQADARLNFDLRNRTIEPHHGI